VFIIVVNPLDNVSIIVKSRHKPPSLIFFEAQLLGNLPETTATQI
jgi:hypothetical protein